MKKIYIKPAIDVVDLNMEAAVLAGSDPAGNVYNQNDNGIRDNLENKGQLPGDVKEAAKQYNAWETWD